MALDTLSSKVPDHKTVPPVIFVKVPEDCATVFELTCPYTGNPKKATSNARLTTCNFIS